VTARLANDAREKCSLQQNKNPYLAKEWKKFKNKKMTFWPLQAVVRFKFKLFCFRNMWWSV